MALSDDLRKRVVEAIVLGGLSRNAAASVRRALGFRALALLRPPWRFKKRPRTPRSSGARTFWGSAGTGSPPNSILIPRNSSSSMSGSHPLARRYRRFVWTICLPTKERGSSNP